MKYLDIGYPYLNLKALTNTHGDLSVALRSTRKGERSCTYVRTYIRTQKKRALINISCF